MDDRLENRLIAANLREAGERLEERGANAFRAAAFCRAADTVEHWPQELREIRDRHGLAGLEALPGVGRESVVIDPRPPARLHGREAIVELLRHGGH